MIKKPDSKLKKDLFKKTGAPAFEQDELLKVLSAVETVKPSDFDEEDFYEADDEEYEDLETEVEMELEIESEIASEI